ncbi:MAG: T9SS type A sorting domain-containing protein [bacterium]
MKSRVIILTRTLSVAFFIFGLTLFGSPTASAQDCGGTGKPINNTNSGKEFLVCFMRNENPEWDFGNASNFQDIFIAAASADSAIVTINCNAFPDLNKVFRLPPNGAVTWRVSTDPVIVGHSDDGILNSDEVVDKKVFRVSSNNPITCYGLNNKNQTADAFVALPKQVASTDYYVLTFPTSNIGPFAFPGQTQPSEFCVAAFENGTNVTITPKVQTVGQHKKAFQITLNAGECYQVLADTSISLSDLTGSHVTSDKQVVVYGGHSRSECPIGFTHAGGNSSSRDHLAEAMPPLTTWGYKYITKNFGTPNHPSADVIRVLASNNGTIVKVDGIPWGKPFAAGEFRDTTASDGNDLSQLMAIESDDQHRILVGMIAHSSLASSPAGDPFLVILSPVDQAFSDYTYFIPDSKLYSEHWLIIFAEEAAKGNISIAGAAAIPASQYVQAPQLTGGKNYWVTTVKQSSGIKRITGPGNFIILAYGWGDVISYGYTAGALYRGLTAFRQVIPPPVPAAPGNGTHPAATPSVIVRNILNEKVYFDSMSVTYHQNAGRNVVHFKEDIVNEIGTLDMGTENAMELVTEKPVTAPIIGDIRIWSHSAQWRDLTPVDFSFNIQPQNVAGVSQAQSGGLFLEHYPNPSNGLVSVHFNLGIASKASLRIYDLLGRVVRNVMDARSQSGEEYIQVDTKGLPAGAYTLELNAPELGLTKHSSMLLVE